MTRTIYKAELDTRHFHFEAIGDSEPAAIAALLSGLEKHAIAYKLPAAWLVEVAGEVRAMPFTLGACYRDREKL